MFKTMLVAILTLGLLSGCGNAEKPAEPTSKTQTVQTVHKKETKKDNLKDALKELKQGKVSDFTDARKTTGVISVIVDLDESQGARSQAGGLISNTKKFIDSLKEKPEKVIVNARYENQKVLQYEMTQDKKLTVVFAHPDIEDYLKKTGYIGV